MAQHPELQGVRANTIRLARNHRHLIDSDFRNDLRCKSLFMEILRQPDGVTHELRRMNRYGIIAEYIPGFGKIVGQMQHDLFHVYTVDEHTLMVIRNLRRFTVHEFSNEFPLCSEVVQKIAKQELMILAGLFHDIAKGRGGSHAELGAIDARKFCERHDLSRYDTNLVSWLVENHLLMSATAQKKDISDPDIVYAFAKQMGDQAHLDYLYLLTVADIRATSDNVWNSWKDTLLRDLYHATQRVIRKGLDNPMVQADYVEEIKNTVINRHSTSILNSDTYQGIWSKFSDEYFLRYRPDEIYWHSQHLHNHNIDEPLVLIRNSESNQITEIFIHSKIQPQLLFVVSSTLEQEGVNIFDARIIESNDHYSLDTYFVLNREEKPLNDALTHKLEIALRENIKSNTSNRTEHDHNALPRQTKQFKFKSRVMFDDEPEKNRTILTVTAFDRPGLLSRIAESLSAHPVTIITAKIATYGERVEDIFTLTHTENKPINDELKASIKEDVISNLDAILADNE